MKKLSHARAPEETWMEVTAIGPDLRHISKIEFPKISCVLLAQIAAACPKLESVSSSNIFPRELDLSRFEGTKLKELKLKTTSGRLKFVGDEGIGALSSLAPTLTKLV